MALPRPPNPAWHEAERRGDTFYDSGRPCKRGHEGRRYVSGDGCVICMKAYAAEYQRKHRPPKQPPKPTSGTPKRVVRFPEAKRESNSARLLRMREACLRTIGVDCSDRLLAARAINFYIQHLERIARDRDAVHAERFAIGQLSRPLQTTSEPPKDNAIAY